MQQYFVKETLGNDQEFSFDVEQSHHIKTVLRMKVGQKCSVVDGQSQKFYVEIIDVSQQVVARVVEAILDTNELPIKITVVQGLIKGERWDWMIQKCSELGADCIVPLQSKRCVVKLLNEKNEKKLVRWNKIALEACEQSKRNAVCEVREVIALKDIEQYRSDLNLVAYEDADFKAMPLANLCLQHQDIRSVTIVVGPEGGFDQQEIAYLNELNFLTVSLGKRILRAETAAMAAVNMLGFVYENQEVIHGTSTTN